MKSVRTTRLQAWSERFGVALRDARKLRRLLHERVWQETKASNGDPHPSTVWYGKDKNANARAWEADLDRTRDQINDVCKRNNLTYDFGTGLWGSVQRDGRYIDNVPE
jgi:hypothetical protein